MRMLVKFIFTAAISISLLIQTGCWDQKLYEEIGFILQMGLEIDENDNLVYCITRPVVEPEVKNKVEILYSSSERLLRTSREKIRDGSGKLLEGGKIQLLYFSKELAQNGINEFLEIYLRNPENPLLANVVVVDGSPKEMMELSLEYKDKPRSAFYVTNLLSDARRRAAVPETRIFNFSILNQSKTIDPVTPMLKYGEKSIEIKGAALFSGDKMVGEIDRADSTLLNALISEKKGFEYMYEGQVPKESGSKFKRGASVSIKSTKRKVKVDTGGKVPIIDIKLNFKAVLDEYSGAHNLDKSEYKKRLEESIERSLQADYMKLLKYLASVGSDPISFGEMVRTKQNKYWKQVNWKDLYKNAVFNVDVKMNIESYGTMK